MISCTNCNSPVPTQVFNSKLMSACQSCNAELRVDVFPALYRASVKGRSGELLQVDKEAGCFYHPRKKAVAPCSACGRFLCALCDVALNGRHLCPACLERGKTQGQIKNLETHRTCYDTIALMVATIPILMFFFPWFTMVTAPLAIYLTVRHWKTPSSIIPRTKIRFILAFTLASLQIAGWIFFFSNLARVA